ncbi:MAG: hypothetical protein ACK5MT_18000 [Actinomycetales bacterium]
MTKRPGRQQYFADRPEAHARGAERPAPIAHASSANTRCRTCPAQSADLGVGSSCGT